ncbi:MAG: hypothetical protein GY862_25400 [Gammaproteobacteria bacterium]|nr:hypothetical protein [Gammaproteobacteria bacterium]
MANKPQQRLQRLEETHRCRQGSLERLANRHHPRAKYNINVCVTATTKGNRMKKSKTQKVKKPDTILTKLYGAEFGVDNDDDFSDNHLLEIAMKPTTPSSRIHMTKDKKPDWISKKRPAKLIETLERFGFTKAGAYRIKEMPWMRVLNFSPSPQGFNAVLYENLQLKHHVLKGYSVDLTAKYQDGTALDVSNVPYCDALDVRPDRQNIFLHTNDLAELYQTLEENAGDKPKSPISPAHFKADCEEDYKQMIAWRNQRGGVTKDEFQRLAEAYSLDLDDEAIQDAAVLQAESQLDNWHDECIEQFRREIGLSAEKWEGYEDGMFIVTEQADATAFLDYLDTYQPFPKKRYKRIKCLAAEPGVTAKSLFDEFNRDLQIPKLGEVSEPIAAEIYYNQTMAWRNQRGKLTKGELQRIAKAQGLDLDDKVMQDVMFFQAQIQLDRWHEECIKQFRRETGLSAKKWKKYKGGMFIVPERANATVFLDYLEVYRQFANKRYKRIRHLAAEPDATAKSFFDELNRKLQIRKLGEVSEPIAAEIYVA